MRRLAATALLSCFGLVGCATLSRDETQPVDIRVLGLDGRPVDDAVCHVTNSAQDLSGNSPMLRTDVVRSSSDLVIECRKPGLPPARATAISRVNSGLMLAVQPMTMSFVDHLTGRMYDYPVRIELVVGKSIVVDRNVDGRPVMVESLPLGTMAASSLAP